MLTKIEKIRLSLEIERGLLLQIKILAKQRGLTLRQIVEYGLLQFIKESKENETKGN